MFIKKFFHSLKNKKALILLICLCYSISFAALCYIYAYEKNAIINNNKSDFTISVTGSFNIGEAKELAKKVTDKTQSGYFIVNVGDENIAYNNKIPSLIGKGFTLGEQNEIVIPDQIRNLHFIGDKYTYNEKEYTIVGYAKVFYLNFDTFDIGKQIYTMWYAEYNIMSPSKIKKVSSLLDAYVNTLRYEKPIEVNLLKAIMSEQFFMFVCVMIGLALVATFVMSIYLMHLRRNMLNVLLSLGINKNKLLLTLILEQVLMFLPCVIIGIGIFFIFYAFFHSILTLISFGEICLFISIYLLIIISGIIINYSIVLKRRYV